MISSTPLFSPCFPPHSPAATTHTLKSSGFPRGLAGMGEADFCSTLLISQGCALLSCPLTPLLQYTQLKWHPVKFQMLHKNTLLRQARKPERNLPVVIVSLDERLGVNDKQGKKKQGRKKKFSGKLVICCEIGGRIGSNAKLTFRSLAD